MMEELQEYRKTWIQETKNFVFKDYKPLLGQAIDHFWWYLPQKIDIHSANDLGCAANSLSRRVTKYQNEQEAKPKDQTNYGSLI